jgi:hypothetical protein
MLLSLAQEIVELPDSDQQDVWTYSWGSPFFSSTRLTRNSLGPGKLMFVSIGSGSAQPKKSIKSSSGCS